MENSARSAPSPPPLPLPSPPPPLPLPSPTPWVWKGRKAWRRLTEASGLAGEQRRFWRALPGELGPDPTPSAQGLLADEPRDHRRPGLSPRPGRAHTAPGPLAGCPCPVRTHKRAPHSPLISLWGRRPLLHSGPGRRQPGHGAPGGRRGRAAAGGRPAAQYVDGSAWEPRATEKRVRGVSAFLWGANSPR